MKKAIEGAEQSAETEESGEDFIVDEITLAVFTKLYWSDHI
jgi:hypothetical protein